MYKTNFNCHIYISKDLPVLIYLLTPSFFLPPAYINLLNKETSGNRKCKDLFPPCTSSAFSPWLRPSTQHRASRTAPCWWSSDKSSSLPGRAFSGGPRCSSQHAVGVDCWDGTEVFPVVSVQSSTVQLKYNVCHKCRPYVLSKMF